MLTEREKNCYQITLQCVPSSRARVTVRVSSRLTLVPKARRGEASQAESDAAVTAFASCRAFNQSGEWDAAAQLTLHDGSNKLCSAPFLVVAARLNHSRAQSQVTSKLLQTFA